MEKEECDVKKMISEALGCLSGNNLNQSFSKLFYRAAD